MKWILRLLCLLLLWPAFSQAQEQIQLQGNVAIPNADHFNGYLRIKLQRSNLKNICTSPYKSVPTIYNTFNIVDGIVQGLNSKYFISQDCLMPRIPYYVEVADKNNIVVSTDNWYLPKTITGLVDIGDLQEQKFSGPINVAIPQGIISTPSGSQTITQQATTSLTINGTLNLNGQVNFGTTPNFATLDANKVLIGGITSSPYPLDVLGFINTSGGYLYGGSGGSIGQCLVSDSVSFKPGTCAPPFPTLYNQQLSFGGRGATQTPEIAFSSDFDFATVGGRTNVTLINVGTPGTYSNIASITTDSIGRVTNVTTSPASTSLQVLASVSFTSCTLNLYGSTDKSCVGSVSWGTTLPNSSYKLSCTYGLPSFSGGASSMNKSTVGWITKTTTGFSYFVANDHSYSEGNTVSMDCIATQ